MRLTGKAHSIRQGRKPPTEGLRLPGFVAQVSNLSVSVRIRAGGANFSDRDPAGLPLPSTGRGNEGEGWYSGVTWRRQNASDIPTPHPGPLPVEGRGRTHCDRACVWLRLCRALRVGRRSYTSRRPLGWKPALQQVGNPRYGFATLSAREGCGLKFSVSIASLIFVADVFF